MSTLLIVPRGNYSPPSSTIPDDVYFHIFALLGPTTTTRGYEDDTGDAWAISQVDRQWRAVALDSPALWSQISTKKGLPVVEAMLERSRNTPVDLRVDLPLTSPAWVHAIVTSNAHRVRGLELLHSGRGPQHDEDTVKTLLRAVAPSPILQRLFLTRVDVSSQWGDNNLKTPLALQHINMIGTLPSSLLHPFASQTTHFSISDSLGSITYELRWKVLLAMLEQMPLLESFTISDIDLGRAHFEGAQDGPMVALPRLALFRAERVRVDYLRHLLRCIDVPSTTRFRFVNIQGKRANPTPPSRSVFKGARHITLACLFPADEEQRSVLLSAHLNDALSHAPDSAQMELLCPRMRPERALPALGYTVNAGVAFKTVEFVDFDWSTFVWPTTWNVATDLAKCRALRFTRCCSKFVIAVFEALSGKGKEQALAEPPCPFLDTIEVREMRFKDEANKQEFLDAQKEITVRRGRASVPPLRIEVTDS